MLDVAERADVIVEMNNPGVWVFGADDDMDRNMGMGVVVEYENRERRTEWMAPPKPSGTTRSSRRTVAVARRTGPFNLKFEKIPGGRAAITAGPSMASLARHQPALHRGAGQALPPGHGQPQW